MKAALNWLKHAFAIDPPGPAEPTPEQKSAVDKVCAEIVKRHLSTPALLFLESSRPLNFLGSQALHFLNPFVSVLTDSRGPHNFAEFLSRRGSVDYLCRKIEDLEEEATCRERQSAEKTDLQEPVDNLDSTAEPSV
ncbi:MAG: hypothetical protein Tsb009_30560 [Planctomycetaceae bacterium]